MRTIARSALPLALVLLAASAHAGSGVNLRWDHCLGDAGVLNKNFACDTNAGSEVLVCSFVLAADIPEASSEEIRIDLVTEGPTLPAWWAFKNAGSCRQSALTMNTTNAPEAVSCVDWASGQSIGLISAYNMSFYGPSSSRIVAMAVLPAGVLVSLSAGTEYFAANFIISHQKTMGAGACAGCTVPACIVSAGVQISAPVPADGRNVRGATNGTDSYFATWQGGTVFSNGGVALGCPYPVPTKRSTWGTVKALYH